MLVRIVALFALSFVLTASTCNPSSTSYTSSSGSASSSSNCLRARANLDEVLRIALAQTYRKDYDSAYWNNHINSAKASVASACN